MKYLSIILLVLFCGCKDKTEIDTPAKWYRIPPTKVLWGKNTVVMQGYSLNPMDSFTCVSAINGCSHCSFYLKPDTVYVHDTLYRTKVTHINSAKSVIIGGDNNNVITQN